MRIVCRMLPFTAYILGCCVLVFFSLFFFLARQLHTKLIFSVMELAAGDVVRLGGVEARQGVWGKRAESGGSAIKCVTGRRAGGGKK